MSGHVFECIKVVDLTWVITGPLIARHMSSYGATVVHVESATRPDFLRVSQPYKDNTPGLDRSGWWANYNSDKYSLALNIRHPKASIIMKRLIEWCDVFIENFSPGVVQKLGLDYKRAKELNPGLIMVSASIQGNTGPHANHPGLGTNLAGLAGFYEVLGWSDRPPCVGYGAFTNFIAPSFAIAAICAALLRKRHTGKGEYIELSQFECGIQTLATAILDYTVNNRMPVRMGNRSPYYAPYGVYRCSGEEKWCSISVTTEEEWESFCQAIGNPELSRDPKFTTVIHRKANEDELDRLVEKWTLNFSPEEVMHSLQGRGVPAGVVRTPADLFNDAQLRDRNYFKLIEHPIIGPHYYEHYGFRLPKTPAKFEMPAPCLGEHNAYICTELLGMSEDEFIDYLVDGVFE